MRSKFRFVVAAAVFVPALALAEPGPLQGACMSDVKALCGSVQPGGGRIRDCMREHRTELSTACKVAIADRMLERGRNQSDGASAAIRPVPNTGH
jgi:hypothetical protein